MDRAERIGAGLGALTLGMIGALALGFGGFSFWRYWIDGVGLASWWPWEPFVWFWARLPEFWAFACVWPGSLVWIAGGVAGAAFAVEAVRTPRR